MTFDPIAVRARLAALTGYMPGPWFLFDKDGVIRAPDGVNDPWLIAEVCGCCGHGVDTSDANARLIAAAPDLAAGYRAALDDNDRLTAENARLRAFIADFAANDFQCIRRRPVSCHPADIEDDVTPLGTVQAWQDDARAALEASHD